jgi:hypothetical protein
MLVRSLETGEWKMLALLGTSKNSTGPPRANQIHVSRHRQRGGMRWDRRAFSISTSVSRDAFVKGGFFRSWLQRYVTGIARLQLVAGGPAAILAYTLAHL